MLVEYTKNRAHDGILRLPPISRYFEALSTNYWSHHAEGLVNPKVRALKKGY
jgi:hypothetical protein